ncbi:MAG: glycosyltransferase family 2 protein [Candidatus Hydrogenedentales bacterium]
MRREVLSLTIVVPTYIRADLLAECLASLEAQTYTGFEVVVVDDGSPAGADIERLADRFSTRLVRLPLNRGFAFAANAGLAEADSPLVMLLNDDMTLAPDCLERLIAGLEADDAVCAAPLILWRDSPDIVYSAGDGQRVDGRPVPLGFRCPRAAFTPEIEVFGASAGAALYRRSALEAVGGFDTRFGSYYEDSDLNFRFQLAGFRAICVAGAIAYHVGSASIAGQNWRRARQCYRNHARLYLKNMPVKLLVRHVAPFLRERRVQARAYRAAARTHFGLVRAWRMYLQDAAVVAWSIPKLLVGRCFGKKISASNLRRLEANLMAVESTKKSGAINQRDAARA